MENQLSYDKGREQGRLEGRLQSMEDRFNHMEIMLDRIDSRLARIEKRESELKGAWLVFGFIATATSAAIAFLVNHFWK